MGEPKIKFGDKIFLYGQFMTALEEIQGYEYNSVVGYTTVGGYDVVAVKSDNQFSAVPGFLVDASYTPELAVATPFSHMEMVDVTDNLSLSLPLPSGTKVWLPTRR